MTAIASGILEFFANVAARAEAATGAGHDHGPDLVIIAGVGECGEYFVDHDFRISVQFLRTVHRNGRDAVFSGVEDLLIFDHRPASHRPVNWAARFSKNARTPSLWSSVWPHRRCVSASRSSSVRKSVWVA